MGVKGWPKGSSGGPRPCLQHGRGFLLHFPHPKSAAKDRWLHTSAHQKVERIYQTFEADVAAKYRDRTQRTPLCQPRAGHP